MWLELVKYAVVIALAIVVGPYSVFLLWKFQWNEEKAFLSPFAWVKYVRLWSDTFLSFLGEFFVQSANIVFYLNQYRRNRMEALAD